MRVRFSLAAPKHTDTFRIFCYTSGVVSLFFEIAIVFAIAAGMAFIMQKLRQPLVLAYLLTGILVGPAVLGLVSSSEVFDIFSKLGVTALLFIVGLSLSPKVMREVGGISAAAGIGQVLFTTVFGFLIAWALGYPMVASFFIALCLTFSSTIIVLKYLQDRRDLGTLYGKIATGILLVQDVVATLVIVFVTAFSSGANSWNAAAVVGGKALLLGVALLFFSRIVLPALTKTFASSQEFLLIFSVAWGAGIAALFQWSGFSIEIGALAAGVSLASSPYHYEISSKMKILRDFFIAVFFISLGAGIALEGSSTLVWPTVLFALFVLVCNPLIVMAILGEMGYGRNVSFRTGLTMAQISEFSLVLIVFAYDLGYVTHDVVSLVTLVGIVTISVSSFVLYRADWVYSKLRPYLALFEKNKIRSDRVPKEAYEAILFGCHRLGHDFLPILKKTSKNALVVDYDPMTVERLTREGFKARYGDAEDNEFLEELDFSKLKLLITTIPDLDASRFLVTKLRRESPDAIAIMMSHSAEEALLLYQDGADYVVLPHFLGGNYASLLLDRFGLDRKPFENERGKHLKHLQQRANSKGLSA